MDKYQSSLVVVSIMVSRVKCLAILRYHIYYILLYGMVSWYHGPRSCPRFERTPTKKDAVCSTYCTMQTVCSNALCTYAHQFECKGFVVTENVTLDNARSEILKSTNVRDEILEVAQGVDPKIRKTPSRKS